MRQGLVLDMGFWSGKAQFLQGLLKEKGEEHKWGIYKLILWRNDMTNLYTAIVTSLLYNKKNMTASFCGGVDT